MVLLSVLSEPLDPALLEKSTYEVLHLPPKSLKAFVSRTAGYLYCGLRYLRQLGNPSLLLPVVSLVVTFLNVDYYEDFVELSTATGLATSKMDLSLFSNSYLRKYHSQPGSTTKMKQRWSAASN